MTCTHHWLIDEAKGPTSKGVCKLCGAVAEFRNHAEELEKYSAWVLGKSYLQGVLKECQDETGGDLSEVQ